MSLIDMRTNARVQPGTPCSLIPGIRAQDLQHVPEEPTCPSPSGVSLPPPSCRCFPSFRQNWTSPSTTPAHVTRTIGETVFGPAHRGHRRMASRHFPCCGCRFRWPQPRRRPALDRQARRAFRVTEDHLYRLLLGGPRLAALACLGSLLLDIAGNFHQFPMELSRRWADSDPEFVQRSFAPRG